jgi:hypothetical protein
MPDWAKMETNSMKRIVILALWALTVAGFARAEAFPNLQFDTLAGPKLTMPAAAAGKPALFIVGFSHASSEQTNYWAKHIPADMVNTYSVAVLQDAPRLVRGMALHGIKSSVPKPKQDHFLVLYSDEDRLKSAAQFQAPDEAYLILIGADGSIQWCFHGSFTHTALKDLRDHVRQ